MKSAAEHGQHLVDAKMNEKMPVCGRLHPQAGILFYLEILNRTQLGPLQFNTMLDQALLKVG